MKSGEETKRKAAEEQGEGRRAKPVRQGDERGGQESGRGFVM